MKVPNQEQSNFDALLDLFLTQLTKLKIVTVI